jgi:hypothetical protein
LNEIADLLINPAIGAEFSSHLLGCAACRRHAGELVQIAFAVIPQAAVASN